MTLASSFGQNRGFENDSRPSIWCSCGDKRNKRLINQHMHLEQRYNTSLIVRCTLDVFSFKSSMRTLPVSITSGITLAAMRMAMNNDAMGSKPVQP